jgi:hypothetical protein
MENPNPKVKYDGDVFTDITSFSMIQNIFDGQTEINRMHVETLDSIIQLLIFYDNIWTVEPFIYGGKIEIDSQEILNTLIQKKVVKQLPQNNSDTHESFRSQFSEVLEIIHPYSLEQYNKMHSEITANLRQYEKNFSLTQHEKAKELADSINLDHRLIPLAANLLRTNYYFKTIQRMKKENNKIVTYCPNVLRSPLVTEIIKHQAQKNKPRIDEIIRKQINLIALSEKDRREFLSQGKNREFELELPVLTGIIVDQCKNKDDFFDQILAWRKDRYAIRMRKLLNQIQIDINNNNTGNYDKYNEKLDNLLQTFKAKSTFKANFVSCLTNPSVLAGLIAGSTAFFISGDPSSVIPGAVPAATSAALVPLSKFVLNRDLYLLFKMREKAKITSFETEKFEKLFDVKVHL